jgi:hypothetical protein
VWAQKFAQLDTRTALNLEFDCVRNRIFFSTGPTEKHDATLNFHDCRAKFYVAAVFLGGESICKVQIASAPMLTFRDSQMEKPEADKFLETFQACPMESTGQTDAKLNHTCPKAALENLKRLLKQGVEATDATNSDANDEEGEKAAKPMLQNVAKPVGEAPVNEQGNDSSDTTRMCIEGKSAYNARYYCNARLVLLKSPAVLVHYEVNGDGSLGALQDPGASKLYVDDMPQKLVKDRRTLETSTQIKGVLEFEVRSIAGGNRLEFEFGNSGYSRVGGVYTESDSSDLISPESPPEV